MSVPWTTRLRWKLRTRHFPMVTWSVIALCAVMFLLQAATGGFSSAGTVTAALWYAPLYTGVEPWRMLTSVFLHGGILHILFNMYSLYVMGMMLEPALGRVKFLLLFLLGGLGGSVGVLVMGTPQTAVLGASGAIFALMGAYLMILRSMGMRNPQFMAVVAINLVWGFLWSGIAWQAHVGGLIVGVATGAIYGAYRQRSQRATLWLVMAVLVVGLAVIAFFGYEVKVVPWLQQRGYSV